MLSKEQLKFQQDILAILDKYKQDNEAKFKGVWDAIGILQNVAELQKEILDRKQPSAPQNIISQIFSTYDIHVQLKHPSNLNPTIVHNRIAEATQELGKLCMKYGIAHVTATEAKNGPGLPPISINH